MGSMTAQEDLLDFLNDPENAQKLNFMVEDVRYALLDYQVCAPEDTLSPYLTLASDFVAAGYPRRELSANRELLPCSMACVMTRE